MSKRRAFFALFCFVLLYSLKSYTMFLSANTIVKARKKSTPAPALHYAILDKAHKEPMQEHEYQEHEQQESIHKNTCKAKCKACTYENVHKEQVSGTRQTPIGRFFLSLLNYCGCARPIFKKYLTQEQSVQGASSPKNIKSKTRKEAGLSIKSTLPAFGYFKYVQRFSFPKYAPAAAISKDATIAAYSRWSLDVDVKDMKKNRWWLYKHASFVQTLCFCDALPYMASGDQEGSVVVYDTKKEEEIFSYKYQKEYGGKKESCVWQVCFDNAGTSIASGHSDGRVIAYDLQEQKMLCSYVHHDTIWALCIGRNNGTPCNVHDSLDEVVIASGSYDGQVLVHSLVYNTRICSYTHNDHVSCITISKDNRFLVSGAWDKRVIIWDIQQNKMHSSYTHDNYVQSVNFIDGIVFSTSTGGQCIMYDITSEQIITSFINNYGIQECYFGKNNRYLFAVAAGFRRVITQYLLLSDFYKPIVRFQQQKAMKSVLAKAQKKKQFFDVRVLTPK